MSGITKIKKGTTSVLILIGLIAMGCNSTNSEEEGATPTFSSGTIAPGGTYSYTFENEGTVEYYCNIHAPDMQGVITISSSASSAERDTVSMEGNVFLPGSLTIAPNTEIIWVNNADHDHTVVSGNPSSGDDGNGGGY